jgi:hypothetical protein
MRTPATPVPILRRGSTIGPVCLAISSLLLLAFPVIRPFGDRTGNPTEIAATFASTSWVAAHIVAGLGFILLPVGLFALHAFLRGTRGERVSSQGLLAGWIGIGLILPTVLGTEAFALRAVGQAAIRQNEMDLLAIATSIRMGPQARFLFAGLLVVAIGAGLMTAAIWQSGTLPRWGSILFALGLAFFFPLFPRVIRVLDGVLIGTGGVWLAIGMLVHQNPHQEEGE